MDRESMALCSDAELLAMARDATDAAQARRAASVLLGRYQGRVYQWCAALLRDPDRARDAAQEVLLSAYRKLDGFSERAQFSSWLFTIARNRCISELRRPQLFSDAFEEDTLSSPDPDPETNYAARASEAELKRLMGRHLTSLEQEAVYLRYFECMPVSEITKILKVTGATGARGILQSARRKLRARFGDRGGFDHA